MKINNKSLSIIGWKNIEKNLSIAIRFSFHVVFKHAEINREHNKQFIVIAKGIQNFK